MKGPG
jgi:hypothetical protein